jgi:hypothetical protein
LTTVQISPEVQLQEMQAHVAMLQNRNLILAQAVAEARAMVVEREARIAELERRRAKLDVDYLPEAAVHYRIAMFEAHQPFSSTDVEKAWVDGVMWGHNAALAPALDVEAEESV